MIEQALKDLLQPAQTASDRRTARGFLAGSAMLYFWCEVAGIDAGRVIHMAALLNGIDEPRADPRWTRASENPLSART